MDPLAELERRMAEADVAVKLAAARKERATREKQRLQEEVQALQREFEQQQAGLHDVQSQLEAQRSLTQTLQLCHESVRRRKAELQLSIFQDQESLKKEEQERQELNVYLTQGPVTELLTKMKQRKRQLQCLLDKWTVKVEERSAQRRDHEEAAQRLDAWSRMRTSGGNSSTARIEDVDEELQVQPFLCVDWDQIMVNLDID